MLISFFLLFLITIPCSIIKYENPMSLTNILYCPWSSLMYLIRLEYEEDKQTIPDITSDIFSNVFFRSPLIKHASVGHLIHYQIMSLNFASIIFEIEDD